MVRGGVAAGIGALAAAGAALLVGGCSDACCTVDSLAIPLQHGPSYELTARIAGGDEQRPFRALVDTGSPISIWNTPLTGGPPPVSRRDITLLGSLPREGQRATRAIFRGISTVSAPLSSLGGPPRGEPPPAPPPPGETLPPPPPLVPTLLMGGDLLSAFSVEIAFGVPQMVLWQEQRASDAFLSASGYAVLRLSRTGGGQLESKGPGDGIGPAGPFQYPPSLLVMRGCGSPAAFDRQAPPVTRCCVGEERTLASGADLALLLGTGYGPIILSRSAWNRLRPHLPSAPTMTPGMLHVATAAAPIVAQMTTLPRLALVDREAEPSVDPGPCVELSRARRLEQVAIQQARNAERAACALPCDQDPSNRPRAQNSAGYLELGDDLPVAVIEDGESLLQTLRAEIRPEGPEIDGIVGAGALRNARVELDYRNTPARAIFSCETEAAPGACRAVGRCPRLPEPGQVHACFGLPAHALPRMCDNQIACE